MSDNGLNPPPRTEPPPAPPASGEQLDLQAELAALRESVDQYGEATLKLLRRLNDRPL